MSTLDPTSLSSTDFLKLENATETAVITSRRKDEHLDLVRNREVGSVRDAGWDSVILQHRALPEINFRDVSTEVEFLGRRFATPFLISSMTGGSQEGERVNESLARFAEARGLPMGVGSQRSALENRNAGYFRLRKFAPHAVLYANLGIVQLNHGVSAEDCLWLVEELDAQALILHANVLQEAIQPEGDRDFSKLLDQIPALKKRLGAIPLILKETGCGLDAATCVKAKEAGFDAVDVAGLGGTHWGYIEGLRDEKRRPLGEMFRDWGIPTPTALREARAALGATYPLIASGGIRHGLDAAKALALGANLVGLAAPFLRESIKGPKALDEFLDLQLEALRIALFCSGATRPSELPSKLASKLGQP